MPHPDFVQRLLAVMCTSILCTALPVWAADAPTASTATVQVHQLPVLPYALSALKPVMDTETLTIHYSRHHQGYVDQLNKALAGTPAAAWTLEQVLATVSTLSPAVRNNAGGHWNHRFFWNSLLPPAAYRDPSPRLKQALTAQFGSLGAFQQAFEQAGQQRFGSGWVWLIRNPAGKLQIISTPNQDNPLMDLAEQPGTPILGCDVWEHAYYLKYQNRRADYLKAFWQLVNWEEVERRLLS